MTVNVKKEYQLLLTGEEFHILMESLKAGTGEAVDLSGKIREQVVKQIELSLEAMKRKTK
jgi:hypothetical protein